MNSISFMKRGTLLIFSIILFWGLFVNTAYAGFGISPPYVRNETLRPGSEYTQEIILVRSEPVEDLEAELALNLPGIEHWFSFDRGMKFILPKGESQVKINISVRVPEDAELGTYNGHIRIRTSSANAPGTGVSIALGAQVDVRLKIVEEIYDFAVRRVELFDAEEGYKKWWLDFPGKIKFEMYVENTGNIPSAPYDVKFQIYDVSGQQLLETTAKTNAFETVLPFATKKVRAYLPTWLPPGGYRVKYSIMKTEEEVSQEGELSLSILPRGTITGYESYGFEGLKLGDKLSVIIPIGLIVFIVVAMFIFQKRRRTYRGKRTKDDGPGPTHRPPPVRAPARKVEVSGGVVDLSRKTRR